MANAGNALRLPGTLTWDGTALGLTYRQRWLPNVRTVDETAEEFGSIAVNTYYVGESPVFLGLLRSWDSSVGTIFPMGSGSSVTMNVRSGKTRPGNDMSTNKGGVLLFTPFDSTNPSVRLYRAVPLPQLAAVMTLRADEDLGFGFAFRATPDSQGRVYAVGVGV